MTKQSFIKKIGLRNQFDFNEIKMVRLPLILFTIIFVYLFLLFFQPLRFFDFESEYKTSIILGYSAATGLMLFVNYVLLPFLWKNFFNYKFWNVGFHILFLAFTLLELGVINKIYGDYNGYTQFNKFELHQYIIYTIVIGLVPSIISIIVVDKLILKKKIEKINITEESNLEEQIIEEQELILIKKDFLIYPKQLICIQANDNYVNVFFINQDGQIKKELIRATLSKLEQNFSDYEQIVRCHRSFIINLNKIEKVIGKVQNYSFFISNLDFNIPVSRNFPYSTMKWLLSKS